MAAPTPEDTVTSVAPEGVAAVIVRRRPGDLAGVIAAVARQVYEARPAFVVSPADQAVELPEGFVRVDTVGAALDQLAADSAFVWFVDQDARPRPDALGALVSTAGQVDASVVGSKILRADTPDELISVGEATDVFGHPYSGLDTGERDQEQYDVIRDVAYVESASVLVRRDLARGIGGLDPRVPYLASGLDFCQRARLAGGRVVVAPASEVLFEGFRGDRALTWREQAGRIRSMIKVYGALTLLWALPGALVVGLVASLYRTFNGRPLALTEWARAWAWNAVHLVSTLGERRRARASRQTGDEELFRYQITGSVELRSLATQLGALIQDDTAEDEQDLDLLFEQTVGFWQQPAFIAAGFGIAFVVFFTRSLWSDGMPSVGFTLPLSADPWAVLRAAAGGWHLAGLGSPEAMHPSIAATAALHHLSRMGPAPFATLLTIAAVVLGITGSVRLLRRCGIGQIPRYAASVVAVAGPAAVAAGSAGYWPALLAMGAVPWALAAVVDPFPVQTRARFGRVARTALMSGWPAAMVPPLVVVPAVFGAVWWAATGRRGHLVRGVVVSTLGVPFMFPWLAAADLPGLLTVGEPLYFDITWWAAALLATAALAVVLAGRGAALRVAGAGAVLAAGGGLLARSATFGSGREVTAAGVVIAGIGATLLVGAALDAISDEDAAGVVRRVLLRAGAAAAAATVLLTLAHVPDGRATLPPDRFAALLAFPSSRADDHGPDRILLLGAGDDLPGEARRLEDGTAYRLVSGPAPTFAQAWLPAARLGDAELESTILRLAEEAELRPGRALVEFGVKWMVFTTPDQGGTVADMLDRSLTSQLDLRPLAQLEAQVFENEAPAPRAVDDRGAAWSYSGGRYVGDARAGSVLVKENADPRWGPGAWSQDGWANRLGTSAGVAEFGGVATLRWIGQLVGILAIVTVAVAIWGRRPVETEAGL